MNGREKSKLELLEEKVDGFIQKFEKFRSNEFRHLDWKVRFLLVATLSVLAMSIAVLCQAIFS